MRTNEYSEQMRATRGSLKSVSEELNTIWSNGSEKFVEWTLISKSIGIKRLSEIATQLTKAEQDDFIAWITGKKVKKEEIELKLMEY